MADKNWFDDDFGDDYGSRNDYGSNAGSYGGGSGSYGGGSGSYGGGSDSYGGNNGSYGGSSGSYGGSNGSYGSGNFGDPYGSGNYGGSGNAPAFAGDQKANGYYEGVVRNYFETENNRMLIQRWFGSLFQGTPFSLTGSEHRFQLYKTDFEYSMNGGYENACDEMRFYGKFRDVALHNDEIVRVWGRKSRNNIVEVSRMYKPSSGAHISLRAAAPAWLIRLITLAMLAGLAFLIYSVTNLSGEFDSSTMVGVSEGAGEILSKGIAFLIICFVVVLFLKLRFGRRRERRGSFFGSWVLPIGVVAFLIFFIISNPGVVAQLIVPILGLVFLLYLLKLLIKL